MRYFNILAGLPPTTAQSGTSFVTTEPAPTTTPSPMVMPGTIVTLAPNHTKSFIVTFFLYLFHRRVLFLQNHNYD